MLLVVCVSLFAPVTGIQVPSPALAAPSAFLQPYSWGSKPTTTTDIKQYYSFGALTLGSAAPASLKTTSPSAGGSDRAVLSGSDPFSKVNYLRAFNGGTPLLFSEGGSGQHMLVAVRNAATNAHEVWGWGLNTSGQLGIGDQCLRRQRIFFFSERDTTYHDYNNDYRVFRYG